MYRIFFIIIALLLYATLAVTEEMTTEEKLKQSLSNNFPGTLEINDTPLPGIYEIVHNKRNVFYTDASAQFIMQGPLIDIKQRKDLTEERLKRVRRQTIAEVPANHFIEFGDPEAEHEIVVFTDVNCGYCRQLHNQRDKYIEGDIKIRYLLTPVLGPDSTAKATSVWCADNRQTAMTTAKSGQDIPAISCNTELDENMDLIRDFNIRGTPAILLKDGTLLRGYVKPEDLLEQIELSKEG